MKTLTTQLVIDIAKRVKEIDPRVSAYAEGGRIKGTFRGKRNETYSYMISKRAFDYNNEGPNVREAVEQAVAELLNH